MPLEIERKFLLKRLPATKFENVLSLIQYYCDKPKARLRSIDSMKFIETKKTQLKPGVYDEREKEIQLKEFERRIKKSTHSVQKLRFIKKMGKLKWEVDVYHNMNLIVAEIELPKEGYNLVIPSYIKEVMIMEVTQFKEFTNKSLADARTRKSKKR